MKKTHHTPPPFASRILRWLLADDWETPAGDFEEYFNQLASTDSLSAAKKWYRGQVFALLPSRVAEKFIWGLVMFLSNMKVAVRTLKRHKWYASINVGGLSIGIAACILIALFIQDELSFDKHHDKADRIGRIIEARTTPEGGEQYFAYTLAPLGPAMKEELPGVAESVHVLSAWATGRQTVQFEDSRFYESGFRYTDDTFFDLFDFTWIAGTPQSALSGPGKAVLTESAVLKYFGDVDPVGKTFSLERGGDYVVSGVIEDPPSTSHLTFGMLLSLDTFRGNQDFRTASVDWNSQGVMTYVLLSEGADFGTVGEQMDELFAARAPSKTQETRTPILQPLSDVHFGSMHVDFDENAGRADISTIYLFGLVAFFILLIACINYTNMATASSLQRAKEVGLRKSVGANKNQLIRQFLSESILTTLGALVLAVVLAALALPIFNNIAAKGLSLSILDNPGIYLSLLGLVAVVGILSGSYPAFLLSQFNPARVLKGRISLKSGGSRIRQSLVVAQFTLSIGLIIASLVVSKQLDFIQDKKLGFNEDQLVVIDINDGSTRTNFRSMKSDLLKDASVESVSVSSNVPGDWKSISQIDVEAIDVTPGQVTTSHFLAVDEAFLYTFEIELLEGRNITDATSADSLAVLLNKSGAEQLGIGLGDRLQIAGTSLRNQFSDTNYTVEVAGIVDDFNFESLHETVGPIVLGYYLNPIDVIDYFTVRLDGGNMAQSMIFLEEIGQKYDPRHPFEFNFLDERLADFYQTESRLSSVFNLATLLAILIACLGLFGLAAYTTAQRTKEIGVRKVMGASASHILVLLSRDLVVLVGVSFLIAAPVTFLLMREWLQSFAYQTNLGMGTFAFALILSLGFALLTVSYQSIRAAVMDPVDSLRYE